MSQARLAVVGGGWAGIAAAVEGVRRGWRVELFEMAGQLGGRARSLAQEPRLDNGQHIMIGAYRDTLALMRQVGVDANEVLQRMPLTLRYADGGGLQLQRGPAAWAFTRAVLAQNAWPLGARLQLLASCASWAIRGFRCAPELSVAQLCAGFAPVLREELIDPLCVAALNTPAAQASAAVFQRVLHDALFGGPGAADLLLPRRPLSELLPEPAAAWLSAQGCTLHLGQRVDALQRDSAKGIWRLAGRDFERVVLAASAGEAARLAEPWNPDWSATARALRFEPIVTVYLRSAGSRLPHPIVALREGPQAPAQYAFDLGQLGHAPDCFAFVISGASRWVEAGLDATGQAVLAQARAALPWASAPTLLRTLAEKRATFACTPDLQRPAARLGDGLVAAGDYLAGPYPATLEGAVRSGLAAITLLDAPR
jgi:squalene-associated FAD-dependent desaturase